MAENGGGSTVGSFFLTVVSFFAILLPGAALSLTAVGLIRTYVQTGNTPSISLGPQDWLVFLGISYLLGQVLFAAGSWFLDDLDECTYRVYVRHRKGDALENQVRGLIPTTGNPALAVTTPYPWARAYLGVRRPTLLNQIDRLDADSKFFRSFTLVFILSPFFIVSQPSPPEIIPFAIGLVAKLAGDLGLGPKKQPKAPWPSWSTVASGAAYLVGFLILLAVGALGLGTSHFGLLTSVFLLIGAGGAFLRFSQQRWQRNETLYEMVLAAGQLPAGL